LAHGAADGQRARNVLLRVAARQLGHGVGDHANLRAVAVHDDNLVALLDEVDDGLGGHLDGLHLLGKVLSKGVAAEGNDDALGHGGLRSKKGKRYGSHSAAPIKGGSGGDRVGSN